KMYYPLGFHDLLGSRGYMICIAVIAISIIIARVDRCFPLHTALTVQEAKRHEPLMKRPRDGRDRQEGADDEKQKIVEGLKKQRYRVRNENGHILAEKGRFSRWGPYVNHTGLIIVLLAALLRFTPLLYMDEYVWVREGQQTVIPGT